MTKDERTDAELLSAVAEDPGAFLGIFERHFAAVHRYVGRQLGASAAEDATAEVFLRAIRSADTFATEASDARPWLLGIATNVIRAELRHRYEDRTQPIESVALTRAGSEDEARLDAVGRLAEVQAALERIPVDEREPLLLYAWLDLPYEDIAIALGVPIGTVRSRIARARRRLRIQFGFERLEAVGEGSHEV